MVILAQFDGICDDCFTKIYPGEPIERNDFGRWQHVHCDKYETHGDTFDDRAALNAGCCAHCGLYHPGEC